MEFRSTEAAIAYLNKRRYRNHGLKEALFFPQQGEAVILHETNFEIGKTGNFHWCFVNPQDPSSYLNLFFSKDATARKYALENGFRIIDESGSYQSNDTTTENENNNA